MANDLEQAVIDAARYDVECGYASAALEAAVSALDAVRAQNPAPAPEPAQAALVAAARNVVAMMDEFGYAGLPVGPLEALKAALPSDTGETGVVDDLAGVEWVVYLAPGESHWPQLAKAEDIARIFERWPECDLRILARFRVPS